MQRGPAATEEETQPIRPNGLIVKGGGAGSLFREREKKE